MIRSFLTPIRASSAACAVLGMLAAVPAWPQGKLKMLDCDKTPGAADCVNPTTASHAATGAEAMPQQPTGTPAPGFKPQGGSGEKPGHGGKGG